MVCPSVGGLEGFAQPHCGYSLGKTPLRARARPLVVYKLYTSALKIVTGVGGLEALPRRLAS